MMKKYLKEIKPLTNFCEFDLGLSEIHAREETNSFQIIAMYQALC